MQGGSHERTDDVRAETPGYSVTGIKCTKKCISVTGTAGKSILIVCLSQAFACNAEADFLLCFSWPLTASALQVHVLPARICPGYVTAQSFRRRLHKAVLVTP